MIRQGVLDSDAVKTSIQRICNPVTGEGPCGKYPASSLLQGPPCAGSSAVHLPEEGGG